MSQSDRRRLLDLGAGTDAEAEIGDDELIEVTVRAPGGTGYLWELTSDDDRFRLVSREIAADETTFGGPAAVHFLLEPVGAGRGEVRLSLKAPWESEPARQHTVVITVVPRR